MFTSHICLILPRFQIEFRENAAPTRCIERSEYVFKQIDHAGAPRSHAAIVASRYRQSNGAELQSGEVNANGSA